MCSFFMDEDVSQASKDAKEILGFLQSYSKTLFGEKQVQKTASFLCFARKAKVKFNKKCEVSSLPEKFSHSKSSMCNNKFEKTDFLSWSMCL